MIADMARAISLFILAGLAEIGGGYLVWQWLRAGKGWLVGLMGGVILFAYGVIPTLQQETNFGRVYAAYGGIFIVLSLTWGIVLDGWWPDRYDWFGAGIVLMGVGVMLWGRNVFG